MECWASGLDEKLFGERAPGYSLETVSPSTFFKVDPQKLLQVWHFQLKYFLYPIVVHKQGRPDGKSFLKGVWSK